VAHWGRAAVAPRQEMSQRGGIALGAVLTSYARAEQGDGGRGHGTLASNPHPVASAHCLPSQDDEPEDADHIDEQDSD